ncbi:Fc receptor-like protein 5 isoform X2 [Dunckerocampus dactyliophorus]|uniref:Fc receptor-like protein 5 isoform X2 n=1 Tax=Dunckerocampus dactyliophorus TaxID=161453 RepID=UPI0024050996|nr:Fc receptor-like protein 5 isoform X2 [Dunckerocampus dactyliophorus]
MYSSRMFPFLLVCMLGSCYCGKGGGLPLLGRPEMSGPSEAMANEVVDFNCLLSIYPKNETILLELFKEGDRDKLLGFYSSLKGETATFPIVITTLHEGNLECVARAQNNPHLEPTVSFPHYLKVIEPVAGAKVITQSGQDEVFEGSTLKLRCKLTAGNHVSYKWLENGQPVSQSPRHCVVDDLLFINRTSSADSGSYMCMATNHYKTTRVFTSNSSEVVITVKDVVSNPEISFSVLKKDPHNYFAVVTCQSTRGTPPVTFSLYNRTELAFSMTVDERKATFKIPLVLERHLGWLQCQACNGDQVAYSSQLPLQVVSVAGPVMMKYDYDIGDNYVVIGLRFYCKATKGSHPRYKWFLNQTLLQDRGSFYYTVHQPPEQSILLLSVGRSSAGTYHCEVSDIFDNSTAISSNKQYFDKDVLNRFPVSVVAVVFGCFTFLILLVAACCWTGVLYRRRLNGEKSSVVQEMETFQAHEDEPEVSEYQDHVDVNDDSVTTTHLHSRYTPWLERP